MAKQDVLKLIESKKVIKASEAMKLISDRKELTRMHENGDILYLGSGLYSSLSISSEMAALMATSKYYPQAVISRSTALRIHGLGEERINKVHVDIANDTSIRNELMEVHRVSPKYMTEIVVIDYQGIRLKVYSEARCLYEALKEYGYTAEYFKAIKRYVARHKKSKSIDSKLIEKLDLLFNQNVASSIAQEVSDDFF